MIGSIIKQTLIEHNKRWQERNAPLLIQAEQESKQGDSWGSMIMLSQYDESEIKRLQLWASTLREYPDLAEE